MIAPWHTKAETPGRAGFMAATVVVLLALNAYPLYQLSATGGYLFYTNAFDEASYLDYEFSRATERPSRSGQYLVTWAHRAGISGGWINLVLDVATSVAFVVLTRLVLGRVGLDPRQARLGALLVMLLPLAFGGLNPLVRRLFEANLASGLIAWVTVPEASTLPIVRSPEPQWSLVLLALGVYASVTYRSFVPAYICMPFLYPFIMVPFAFVVLAVHLRARLPSAANHPAVPPLLAFGAVALALWAYFGFGPDDGARGILAESRYPLVSFTAAAGLVLYRLVSPGIPAHLRYVALMIVLAPLAAANQQVVTGWLAQPNNFEQVFGVSGLGVVSALWAVGGAWRARVALPLAGAAVLLSAVRTFEQNEAINRPLPLTAKILETFRTDSAHVMLDDVPLASRASMLFPRQASTVLAYQRTFPGQAATHLTLYRCAKAAALRDGAAEPKFRAVFADLDRAYRHENQDFILLHLGRRTRFSATHDVDASVEACPSAEWRYVVVERR